LIMCKWVLYNILLDQCIPFCRNWNEIRTCKQIPPYITSCTGDLIVNQELLNVNAYITVSSPYVHLDDPAPEYSFMSPFFQLGPITHFSNKRPSIFGTPAMSLQQRNQPGWFESS